MRGKAKRNGMTHGARLRAGLGPVRAGCLLAALLLTGLSFGAFAPNVLQAIAAEVPKWEPTFATQDGLLTAIFPESTDDAALRAAVPSLIARGVQSVNLRGLPIRDIRPLAAMTGLRALNLCGTRVRDFTPLAGFAGLRTLSLQFLPIADLAPLAGLTNMRVLNLGGTDIDDLTPLAGMAELEDLYLAVTKVRSLTPLASLRRLISLNLESTKVRDLRPLAEAGGLRFLTLNGTLVDDVRPIGGLTGLQRLDLGGTEVSDVRPLSGMRNLYALNLEGTRVADVTALSDLTGLRSLSLSGSPVGDGQGAAKPVAAPPMTPAADPVLFWIAQTNLSIQAAEANPFQASRVLALESIAVLDTIKSLAGAPAYLVRLAAPRGLPVGPAVSAAAHRVLSQLFPERRPALDDALAAALADDPPGPAQIQAMAFGRTMADNVLAARSGDGWNAKPGLSRAGNAPGQWRPTPPDYLPPVEVQWAFLKPFALLGPAQFRPLGPPAVNSIAFWDAKSVLVSLGSARSTSRTPEQTEIALYWADGPGSFTSPGHWNTIATDILRPLRRGMGIEAEVFAELNVALADAAVAAADTKYNWWTWRPVTTFAVGGDGDRPIPGWMPLLETPNHPSYISGHSTFSGAAATVLTAWFGTSKFASSGPGLPGVRRVFSSFQQAAEEAGDSRVFGGIHFPFENTDGLAVGRAVGAWTLAVFQRTAEERGPMVMLDPPGLSGASSMAALTGCALNNLSPVTSLSARLDDGEPFSVPVDERGLFAIPAPRLGAPGKHRVVLTATSVTGRSHALTLDVETNQTGDGLRGPVLVR